MRLTLGLAAALFCGPLIAGCYQTAATREYLQTSTTLKQADADSQACWKVIHSDPEFAPLRAKSPLFAGNNDPTMAQLTDMSRPTSAHARLISEYHARLEPCRSKWLQGTASVPMLSSVYRTHFAKMDVIYAGLVRRDMSWGEANGLSKRVDAETTREHEQAAERYAQNLDRRHQRELDALDALGPIRCTKLGSSITCR